MLHKIFLSEKFILGAIVANAVIIFLLAFPAFNKSTLLGVLDTFFLLFFVAEMIVKMRHYGRRRYFREGWNGFDFVIVMISLPSLLTYFLPVTALFNQLLILRVLRIFRVAHFFTFLPHMQMIVAGLGRALRASVFVIASLVLLNIILAIFATHMYADVLPEYFRDPFLSSYTIFQMFTIEGWNTIPELISERTDSRLFQELSRWYFLFVVLLGGIFGLSLANAVFVDEMTIDNNKVLEDKIDSLAKEIAELKQTLK